MNLFCNFFPLSFVKTQTWEGKFANNSKEVIFIIKQCQKKTLNPKPSVPICTQSASAMYRNENLYGSVLTFLHTYINENLIKNILLKISPVKRICRLV